jgi:hypothetical protein
MARCASCGTPFTCGLRETNEPCWCAQLPPLALIDPRSDCLCRACLTAKLDASNPAAAAINESPQFQ